MLMHKFISSYFTAFCSFVGKFAVLVAEEITKWATKILIGTKIASAAHDKNDSRKWKGQRGSH
jgi:xanthosine utilization system XapX-like protein